MSPMTLMGTAVKRIYQHACKRCGTGFSAPTARKDYCSDACKFSTRQASCRQCLTGFTIKSGTTGEFCSRACWYVFYDGTTAAVCQSCGKSFDGGKSSMKYCGNECRFEGLRTAVRNKSCERCNKKLRKDINPKTRFCSKSCSAQGRSPIGRSSPIGTIGDHASGYKTIKVGQAHPGANKNGWMLHHRYVVEQDLDRYLERHERVHHRNGQRDDNRIENLELWKVKGKKDPAGVRAADYHCPGCRCQELPQ